MDSNATQLSFDTTPAASVSLACCQSLCDLLKELPLPQPVVSQSSVVNECLSLNQNICQNFALIDSQLESALSHAKQQMLDLVWNESRATQTTTAVSPLSPLVMHLSLKGLFGEQQQHVTNSWTQLESNSLETIEPSIRTELEFNENLKLIDELHDDCNDTDDSKYYSNDLTASDDTNAYSSLGERVKSRQRQQQQNVSQNSEKTSEVTTGRDRHNCETKSDDDRQPTVVNSSQRQERQSKVSRREQPKEQSNRSHSSHKTTNHSNHNNISHDFQNKDSLVSFELIVNKLLRDCVNDNNDSDDDENDDSEREDHRKNDMSFDLRIDLKELNLLMSLSSKLKHSNKTKDLEQRLSSKLSSFLSLLTNKMIVWFSKFKENEELQHHNNSDDSSHHQSSDDNVFWQLLINASKMALNIMTSRGMSSRVVLFEELLEIIINFLSHNLNSKTHVTSRTSCSPQKKSKASSVLLTTSATKRQVTHWTELLELLAEYSGQNRSLNDSIILMITRIAMSSLFLNANEMQLISIQLLQNVFREYPKHRNSILEELLQSFHRIPAKQNRRTESNAASANSAANCQSAGPLTRLLVHLTNALFSCERSARITREMLTKQLTDCLAIISAFLSSFIKKCLSQSSSQSSSDCDLKCIFENLLNDLLSSLYFPQTISSLLLIQILTKLLINNLNQNSSKSGTTLQIRLNSIEFLANISSKFAKLLSEDSELKSETNKTLNQLLGSEVPPSARILEILKLLNRFFVSERLFAEKQILSSLWIKEKPILELESKFFSLLNAKDVHNSDDDSDSIDATTAQLFIKCLELSHFATIGRLFDASLSHVTSSLSLTTNTTQRSRAMKSLSQILVNCTLERSTQLLARNDLQIAMRSALLDASTSVREATVDLIGRFVLQSKALELCEKYCDLIGERILDTGVSVRKRVIKILRDVCIEFPEFEKCGEIQLRIIKRVNDEGEGIRKLVLETVRDLWFKSLSEQTSPDHVSYKVMSLLHVISVMLQTEGTVDSLQQLIEQIVKNEVLLSAEIIVDFVVARVLTAAEPTAEDSSRKSRALLSLSAVHLIHIFAQICPQILVKHCDSLQSLLSLSCDTLVDIHLRNKLIQSLERVLHKLSNPSQQLLCRLEEDLTKQILQASALILPNSVKCLSVLIRVHTLNHKLSTDLFLKFKQILLNNLSSNDNFSKPKLLRAIYSLGLFLKHFSKTFDSQTKGFILDKILFLIQQNIPPSSETVNGLVVEEDRDSRDLICHCITSLGFIIESDPKICLNARVVHLYERVLRANERCSSSAANSESFAVQVLNNFRNYLSESMETDEQLNKEIEWNKESLKQMSSNDEFDSSSIQSQIIQTYLTLLLDKSLSASAQVRRVACSVIHVIQSGGHVHPLQLVPHLIAMTTDDDQNIRSRADHVLHEIERKFHGFVAMKAKAGIQLATQLCARLKCRGFRLVDENSGDVTSRLATLYHVICTNRQSRRGFIQQLLRHFEVNSALSADDSSATMTQLDSDVSVGAPPLDGSSALDEEWNSGACEADCARVQLMFESVLFFPFNVCDEILYILQQLECIQSVNSTHTSQLFCELFDFQSEQELDDKYDDNYETFARDVTEEKAGLVLCKTHLLAHIYRSLKRVFLVSFLRKLLKEFFLLKDEKIMEYSPNEPKLWEKPIHRRQIETRFLCETLCRANPNPSLVRTELTIEEVLEEFKRFKSVSLTSNDTKISSQLLQQKLFSIQTKKSSQKEDSNQKAISITIESKQQLVSMETNAHSNRVPIDDLNDSERKRLLESIRRTSCQVSLIDIGIDPQIKIKRKSSHVTPNKRKRVRPIDTSDEEAETPDDERETDGDSDDHSFH